MKFYYKEKINFYQLEEGKGFVNKSKLKDNLSMKTN